MRKRIIVFIFALLAPFIGRSEEISPYKFTKIEELTLPYTIPDSSRFKAPRLGTEEPDVIYYFSPPKETNYPIAILCAGSSSKGSLSSVIHIHRYFLQELWDLELGVLTVEQWGIDGNAINEEEFFAHYTRSQRLLDHRAVIHHLKKYPPSGWNGKFVFIGVSEGGPIVTELTALCSDTIATINWCGAGGWAWKEELWYFFEDLKQKSWVAWLYDLVPRWLPFSMDVPRTWPEYESVVDHIIQNPISTQWMAGMTYLYHADAFQTPPIDYQKLQTPFLVVAGTEDPNIHSSDQFVQKAKEVGVPISYFRIEGMDHYVRHRPDVLQNSFKWLREQLDLLQERTKN